MPSRKVAFRIFLKCALLHLALLHLQLIRFGGILVAAYMVYGICISLYKCICICIIGFIFIAYHIRMNQIITNIEIGLWSIVISITALLECFVQCLHSSKNTFLLKSCFRVQYFVFLYYFR